MTTREHLEFYARAKGIPATEADVNLVMEKIGLQPYESRLASKLSGGNKRKLSLAIAILGASTFSYVKKACRLTKKIGNPSVLLLDEPSSSMDAASKRVMWKTLAEVTAGRSLLLTVCASSWIEGRLLTSFRHTQWKKPTLSQPEQPFSQNAFWL